MTFVLFLFCLNSVTGQNPRGVYMHVTTQQQMLMLNENFFIGKTFKIGMTIPHSLHVHISFYSGDTEVRFIHILNKQ